MAKLSEKHLQRALYVLIASGVLLAGYALVSSNFQISGGQPTPTPVTTQTPKAQLVLTVITVPECRYCTDLKELVTMIKSAGDVQIISEKTVSYKDAGDLIAKYGVKKVPAILLSGETAKVSNLKNLWRQIGEESADGTLVLTKLRPMYYDLEKKEFVGKLKVTRLVNSSCGILCTQATTIQSNFETTTGIRFVEEQEREFNSTQGKELTQKYNITKIPSIIITGDIAAYDELGLKNAWKSVGTEEQDGALVWRLVQPPYQEIPSGKLKGLAVLMGIIDQDCKACYDLEVHSRILGRMGVQFSEISYYNYTQPKAKELIEKYNITLLPTVLIDEEMEEYYPFTQLEGVWKQIGSTEKDGWHVFRNMSSLGSNVTYKNALTNQTLVTE